MVAENSKLNPRGAPVEIRIYFIYELRKLFSPFCNILESSQRSTRRADLLGKKGYRKCTNFLNENVQN